MIWERSQHSKYATCYERSIVRCNHSNKSINLSNQLQSQSCFSHSLSSHYTLLPLHDVHTYIHTCMHTYIYQSLVAISIYDQCDEVILLLTHSKLLFSNAVTQIEIFTELLYTLSVIKMVKMINKYQLVHYYIYYTQGLWQTIQWP
jgi:hypothetical protein